MLAALALLILLALAAPAPAQTWSPPQRLSSGHDFVSSPRLVMTRDGSALAGWQHTDGSRSGSSRAAGASGGPFGPARALPRRDELAGLAGYGRRRVVLGFTRREGPLASERIRLGVRFGTVDGRLGRPVTVRDPGSGTRTASHVRDVSLAVNARGAAALAWFEDRGVRTDRVYVSLRRPGGRFGAPRRLATGRVRSVAAAIGASGDALVAWDALGVVRTRFKPRTRDGFRATETIRSEDAFFADLHPLVTLNGRAVLAWSAEFASEGGESGPLYFQAAVRPSGASRFRRAQLLERLPASGGQSRLIDAVTDASGNVTLAWSGSDGGDRRVKAARVEQDGAVGIPQVVSPAGGDRFLSDLAAAPGGRVIAVWEHGIDEPESAIGAAVAEAGAPFGAPELVTPPGEGARFGVAALDGSGRPAIVYSASPTPGAFPAYAHATTRSG